MLKIVVSLTFVASLCQAGVLLDSVLPANILPIDPMQGQVTKPQLPAFCHGVDCPRYSVLESNDKFEVRHYEPSVWVATKLTTMLYTKAESDPMFWKLFQYISGNNSASIKIPMTAPVVTEVEHGQGPDCESNFTMYFMIPFNLQANPPTPTDPSVFISRQNEFTVIVKTYGGFSNDQLKRYYLEEFIGDLDAANKKYADNIFLTAGYDGPYTFTNRHNELWVVAE